MVFRAESEFDRVAADGHADGASDGWTGDVALAIISMAGRQECLSHKGAAPLTPGLSHPPLTPINCMNIKTKVLQNL